MKARVTQRDTKLAHQISLRKTSHSMTAVHCNCRVEALGIIHAASEPWEVYNNPSNHNQIVGPFVPTSTAKVFDV